LRLFYAVFVPDALKPALEAAQTKIVGRWWKKVETAHFHITLLFIGGVPGGVLERFKTVGREISRDSPSFTANLRGTGFFPNEGSPRVWFAKAEGDGFKLLAEALRDHLEDVIADAEPFKPHVTLARKKGSSPRPPPIVIGQEFPVTHFALVESSLSKLGPQYKILETFPLIPSPLAPDPLAPILSLTE
jgi:RNA 2',3'-cyclic 3'-phosphodiesterase